MSLTHAEFMIPGLGQDSSRVDIMHPAETISTPSNEYADQTFINAEYLKITERCRDSLKLGEDILAARSEVSGRLEDLPHHGPSPLKRLLGVIREII